MPDEPVNLTTRILKEIRDEVRRTNERLDATNARIVESELRTATAITDLATNVRDLTTFLRSQNDMRPRVERCENDIAELRGEVAALRG